MPNFLKDIVYPTIVCYDENEKMDICPKGVVIMEHRHFTLNQQKQYMMDRYEVEKQYIFSSNGEDATHMVFDYPNMEKLEDVMKAQIGRDYAIDNFTEYFKTRSMADLKKLCKQWSIKYTLLD